MKKTFLISLLSVIAFVSFSCSSDDDDTSPETLVGGEWKLVKFTIDGLDVTEERLDECELLETFEFTNDGKFVRKDFIKNEATGNCDADDTYTGTWTEDGLAGSDQKFKLVFDNDADDDISLVLGRFVIGFGEDVEQQDGTLITHQFTYEKK